jgi:regulator of sirC expression with transglutaminase-like and TPR domain
VSRHLFDLLVELPSKAIRLDYAALHLARDVYPHLNAARYLRQLDALAEEVAAQRPGLAAPLRYQALREVLVRGHGFTGNQRHYFDPQNSYLNRVLERRVGIPVSLSIIWLEVARRLKWPVAGVALPGHFLVRFEDPERFVLADPFGDGRSLALADCRRLLAGRSGNLSRRRLLQPASTRTVLARALRNLRRIYLTCGDWQNLVNVLQRLSALEPHSGRHLRDLAAAYARLGQMRHAYGCLSVYLDRVPDAGDGELVRSNLARLEAAMAALN